MKNKTSYTVADILGSIDGIQRAEPGHFLFTRIQQQIRNEQPATLPAGLKKILVPLYASLVLFITVNLVSYLHFSQKQSSGTQVKQTPAEAFAGEYGLETSVY